MKKILFLTVRADFGGGPEHLWQLLRHLSPRVEAFVACPQDYPYYERYCGLLGADRVFILPHRKFRLGSLLKLAAFCRKRGVEVLHSHGKGAGLYSRPLGILLRLPCAHTFHGVHVGQYGRLKKFLYVKLERLLACFTQAGIAVSQGEREQVSRLGLFPASRLHLIENGVELPAVAPAAQPEPARAGEPACAGEHVILLHTSRFDYAKNSEFLLPLLRELRQRGLLGAVKFTALGDGEGRAALQAACAAEGLDGHIEFTGAVSNPADYMARSFAYVSTSRWEGLPLGVLEAMAHGLPVLASDVVGNRDAVRHEHSGFLYAEGQSGEFCDYLQKLLEDRELYAQLRRNARHVAEEKYDVRIMARKCEELLLSL